MPVTQYSMKPVEDVGLVKIDFLGLKTLQVVDKTIQLVRERHGVEIDPLNMPLDDEKTYEMLGEGETDGVFQLESEGMRRILRQLKPNKFEHHHSDDRALPPRADAARGPAVRAAAWRRR
jgi:DNA polymerase-3 subunit alpha